MITEADTTSDNALRRVRVVIPCRNEAGYIGRCLRSLIEADRSELEVEAWVCDGMSDDGTREEVAVIAKDHAWIHLVDNAERTTPQAMNLGLRPEGYDVGIILGAHAEVARAFFRENVALLAAHPEAGCVGGVIENVYLDRTSRRIGAAMSHPFGVGGAHFRTGMKEGEVDTVAFGAYRRSVFEQIGYFDERLVRNQDDEFNYRVVKSGWKIRLSSAIRSKYYVRGTYARLFRQYKQYGYWKVYVNRLHGTVTTMRQLVPALFVAYLIAGAIFSLLLPLLTTAYGIGLLVYVSVALASAFHASSRIADVPGVFIAFIILHFSYGIGYLQGLIELVLLGRDPKKSAHTLTR